MPNAISKRSLWVVWLCVLLSLCSILAILVAAAWWLRTQALIADRIGNIRARGEPTTAAELAAYYAPPPADRDTTKLWLAAFAALDAAPRLTEEMESLLRDIDSEIEPIPHGAGPSQLEVAQRILQARTEFTHIVRVAASAQGDARFPIRFQDGPDAQLPHLNKLRQAANVLALETKFQISQQDSKAAVKSILAITAILHALDDEPLAISQFVRFAVHEVNTHLLHRLLRSVDVPLPGLESLQSKWESIAFEEPLRRGLLGDRVMMIGVFNDPSSEGIRTHSSRFLWKVSHSKEFIAYLDNVERRVIAIRGSWPAIYWDDRGIRNAWTQRPDPKNCAFDQAASSMDTLIDDVLVQTTANRIAILALAMERYRLENGHPPKTLEELAPKYVAEVPADPISGTAFHYQVTDKEYLVFSRIDKRSRAGEAEADAEIKAEFAFRKRLVADAETSSPEAQPQPEPTP